MRILFVGKRHPQQRDLIERPYGRFHHLPTALAALGHDVRVLLCSHRKSPGVDIERDGVRWSSRDIALDGPTRLLSWVRREAAAFRPDWVIGMSDAWYGWLAHSISRRVGCRLGIDAYDNYEAYMRWNLPLHWAWRRSLHAADLVTAAGPQLAERLQRQRRSRRTVDILPMTADPVFGPRDRVACRIALGLPPEAPLLGYVGSWTQSRGTHLIVDAFDRIRAVRPDARLVLSGKPPASVLDLPGVIGLGYLPDDRLPLLVSALDVACIVTANTAFGRYSYPAKLCEAMACRVPVVASATDAVAWMLGGRERHLAPPGDPAAFAQRTLSLLRQPTSEYDPLPTWTELGRRLGDLLAVS